jgi:hypothetical protein
VIQTTTTKVGNLHRSTVDQGQRRFFGVGDGHTVLCILESEAVIRPGGRAVDSWAAARQQTTLLKVPEVRKPKFATKPHLIGKAVDVETAGGQGVTQIFSFVIFLNYLAATLHFAGS